MYFCGRGLGHGAGCENGGHRIDMSLMHNSIRMNFMNDYSADGTADNDDPDADAIAEWVFTMTY